MKLQDRFELAASPSRVWDVLNDVERIAPYVPGFSLKEADGDVYRGTMKVKLGAMTVQYEAEITIAERDSAARSVRMLVSGRERRGTGRMSATVTSRLESSGAGAAVTLETDLDLAGKVAQMGRGMIADVSGKLVADFVRSLEENVLREPEQGGSAQPQVAEPAPAPPPEDDIVDLTGIAGRSAARRLGPAAVLVFGVLLVVTLRRRGR